MSVCTCVCVWCCVRDNQCISPETRTNTWAHSYTDDQPTNKRTRRPPPAPPSPRGAAAAFYLEDDEDDGEEEEAGPAPLSPSRVKALGLCRGILGRVLPSLRSTASFRAMPSSAVVCSVEWVRA